MVKYLIPLIFLSSCKAEISDKLKISLKEVFIEYKVMTFDEYKESDVIYKPDNVTLTFILASKIDSSLVLNFNHDGKGVNSFFYWLNSRDSIELRAFITQQTLLPQEELEMTVIVPYDSFGNLQSILRKRKINSIYENLKKSKFVFKTYLECNYSFFDVSFGEVTTIFIFSDTTIFFPPLMQK